MRDTAQHRTSRRLWEAYGRHNILFWPASRAEEERDLRFARFGYRISIVLLLLSALLEVAFIFYVVVELVSYHFVLNLKNHDVQTRIRP